MESKIPRNFFYYWSGQDFYYINYLCILSLLSTNRVEKCEVYYDEEPRGNENWGRLKKIYGIKFIKIDFDDLLKKAGFDRKEFNKFFNKANIVHISDLFRYLILYCNGGIYSDFDVLFIKDFEPLINPDMHFFAAFEDYDRLSINGAVMGAMKEAEALKICIEEVKRVFKKKKNFAWAQAGPRVITGILCPKPSFLRLSMSLYKWVSQPKLNEKKLCSLINNSRRNLNFEIYPKSYFYPHKWEEWKEILQSNASYDGAYSLHLWQHPSGDLIKNIDKAYIKTSNSPFATLVKSVIKDEYL